MPESIILEPRLTRFAMMQALPGSLILGFVAEQLLFTFNLSVLACIVRNRRVGNAVFRTGFFSIYIMQSIADYVNHVVVRSRGDAPYRAVPFSIFCGAAIRDRWGWHAVRYGAMRCRVSDVL